MLVKKIKIILLKLFLFFCCSLFSTFKDLIIYENFSLLKIIIHQINNFKNNLTHLYINFVLMYIWYKKIIHYLIFLKRK